MTNKHVAYQLAKQADDAFEAELDRQFGTDACDKRYMGRLHDQRTAAAREAYRAACAKLHDAWDANR